MKIIFSLIILIASANAFACGQYQVKAKVQLIKGYPHLIVYPGTQSEIDLSLKFEEIPKLSAYIDHNVSAEINITDVDATLGLVSKITNIQRYIPNLMIPGGDTDLKLTQYEKCKK